MREFEQLLTTGAWERRGVSNEKREYLHVCCATAENVFKLGYLSSCLVYHIGGEMSALLETKFFIIIVRVTFPLTWVYCLYPQ